ncbi:Cyclic nucleotide-gated ion channel 1 [Citrus sinensis]|nr:Cyclic nucleotide-gated ion channel 1 [Citrus sinensis]
MPTWHQLRRRGLTTRQHMIDDMSSLDWITLLTRVSTKILKLACGAHNGRDSVFWEKRNGRDSVFWEQRNGRGSVGSCSRFLGDSRCPHLSVCPSSPPFSGSGSPSRDSNRCIVANVGTYVSFNGSGKSVTVAILCSVKSITAAILCSGNSVTAAVLWDRVPAFWGTGIGLVYTSGRYIPLAGVPLWSVYACQGFPSGRFMLVPVFGSYHRLRSQHSNLEEGTPRLVAGVEMDSISRSEREATVSAFLTVIESLGNGVKTSLRQIRNLSRRFLEANFWLIYVYSMVFDPVFLYLPVTNDDKKCFQFDKDVMTFGILERTVYDTPFLIIRALPIWENWRRNCSISRLPVFLFDLSIILPLPQVFGALWYFFALQRKTECWRKACTDSTKCRLLPLHCDNSLTNYTFSNDFCSTKTQNATIYDFGIFFDAINSGVIEQNNLFLSSFGQGLPFSTNVWENIFVISITITGVRLFFFLIGKVQYEMSKAEEIRQKVQEIYQWPPFRKLPKELQKKVRRHPASKLRGTTGVDVEMVNNLPEDLRKSIKQNLCLDLLKKVEEFGNWSDSSLETLCDVVKPVVFTERSYILQEGNPIDQMLFVLHDKLWTYTSRSIAGSSSNSGNPNNHLEDGDFSGEELIAWAKADRDSSNLPLSTKTIQALTKVEAFLLMADYLKQVLLDIDH